MTERVTARACSLDAGPGVFRIVLTVDIGGAPYQVEFTEQGEKADRYASEVHRQARLGEERERKRLEREVARLVDEKNKGPK